jgi:hypothetical protein
MESQQPTTFQKEREVSIDRINMAKKLFVVEHSLSIEEFIPAIRNSIVISIIPDRRISVSQHVRETDIFQK